MRLSQLSVEELVTAGTMALNFFSSTSIVVANKYAMDSLGFHFGSSLTLFHFLSTSALLYLTAHCLGLFERKSCDLRKVAKLAAGAAGFVVLTNLSLQYNSIGFYQVMKVMTTPTIVVIEAVFYQKHLENRLKVALLPVCLGVVLTTTTDFRLNLTGTLIAIAGVLVTSLYQIWSGTLQRSLQLNALQLQYYTSPLSALFLTPFVPLLDNWRPNNPDSIFYYEFTIHRLVVILATGILAFLVNVSIFMVIGRTSPVTYNVLGHAKTAVIIASDFLFFGRPKDVRNMAGVVLTMVGVVWYTHLKLQDQRAETPLPVNRPPKESDKSGTSNP
jgi:solute carrier family 35 protein E3